MIRHYIRRGTMGLACLALAAAALLPGCVERKITLVSDPPGALTYVNDVEVGRTPVTIPFLWYGDYDVRLRADKTAAGQVRHYYLHTHRVAKAPVFQWLGVDLLASLVPVKFVDHKIWAFDIPPVPQPSQEELVQRAAQLKSELNEPASLGRPRPNIPPSTRPATRPARPRTK